MERLISLLGLISMLLIAWLLSYHKTKIKWRPIVWGMSLQFILAMIILQTGALSFVGMVCLGLILVTYILKDLPLIKKTDENSSSAAVMTKHGIHGAIGLAAGAGLYFLPVKGIIGLIGTTVVLMLVNSKFMKNSAVQKISAALFVIANISYLISTQTTGREAFKVFSDGVENFLALSDYGSAFLFGNLVNAEYYFMNNEFFPGFGFLFAFKVLPTIIFFGGFMSVLYYLGIMGKVIGAMSQFMRWTLGTSGSESLSCSANIFVGQTEAPLLIKPYLRDMTRSELLTIMVGGFATIAGGVLAGYINMGVDAGHLIAASVMSAPAALVIAKIIYPELEHSTTAGDVELPEIEIGDNILEAASNGITDGFKLAMNVGAMLIGFIALIAVVDVILNFLDYYIDGQLLGGAIREYDFGNASPVTKEYLGIFPGSLQTLFATVLSPLAWLMGVPSEDAGAVANLLGLKLSLNEFVAFGSLGTYINGEVIGERAQIIATYALCGFANFASVGVQLGGISSLAPERRADLAKVVLRAMIGGALASWTTACIAGLML